MREITRKEALEISGDILEKAEAERYQDDPEDERPYEPDLMEQFLELGIKHESLRARNAELEVQLADLEASISGLIAAESIGHNTPCTYGQLCPYCEIEGLESRLSRLRDAAEWYIECWESDSLPPVPNGLIGRGVYDRLCEWDATKHAALRDMRVALGEG